MATFRVERHIAITGRGAFLLGQIESGAIKAGDVVTAHPRLTIAAVEMADDIAARESWVALRFAGDPSKADLELRFPVGTVLDVRAH